MTEGTDKEDAKEGVDKEDARLEWSIEYDLEHDEIRWKLIVAKALIRYHHDLSLTEPHVITIYSDGHEIARLTFKTKEEAMSFASGAMDDILSEVSPKSEDDEMDNALFGEGIDVADIYKD